MTCRSQARRIEEVIAIDEVSWQEFVALKSLTA